jgi:predicted Zn finger-like uncharacterized protein
MAVTVSCSSCQARYQVPAAHIGAKARCKRCGTTFEVKPLAAAQLPGQAGANPSPLEKSASRTRERLTESMLDTVAGQGTEATREDSTRSTAVGNNRTQARTDSTPVEPVSSESKASVHRDPSPGKIGRFEIKSKLGAGAFGTVYRAFDPVLKREVALKVPQSAALETEETRARLMREPEAAAQLRHPNIVPIFDAGFDGDTFYIASAFIEGETLESAIARQRPEPRRAAQLALKLAEALDYAGSQGVVHRDVKPANVMLDGTGEPHLMDFGLARLEQAAEKLTQDGSLMGTPAYMSPEQAGAAVGPVAAASDQYSLGVVLFELLCGQRPFNGPPVVVLYEIREKAPPSPRSIDPSVPRDLETICLKAMARRPQDRYARCSELADDLRRWLNGELVRARRPSLAERSLRWCRRHPAQVGLVAAAIGLIVLGVVLNRALTAGREAAIAGEHARVGRYRADLRSAQAALAQGDRPAAARLLLAHLPEAGQADPRGWEWYYLLSSPASELRISSGEGKYRGTWSPAGNLVAVAARRSDPDVLAMATFHEVNVHAVYDSRTAEKVFALPHANVAWSPDGTRLFGWSGTGGTAMDVTGRELFRDPEGGVVAAAWSPDAAQLLVMHSQGGSGRRLVLWNASSGQQEHEEQINCQQPGIAWNTASGRLAITSSREGARIVEVRDLAAGQPIFQVDGFLPQWSWDGEILATRLPTEPRTAIWNGRTGQRLATLPLDLGVLSPDGEWLAGNTNHAPGIDIFSARGQSPSLSVPNGVGPAAWSPDSRSVAVITNQAGAQGVEVWSVARGVMTARHAHASGVQSITWSPDGDSILSCADDAVIWRPEADGPANTVRCQDLPAWHAEDRGLSLIARADDQTGTAQSLPWVNANPTMNLPLGVLPNAAWSPDGQRLAFVDSQTGADASAGPRLVVADARTSLERVLESPAGAPNELIWSPDGLLLAIAYASRQRIGIWDPTTGKPRRIVDIAAVVQESNRIGLDKSAYYFAWAPDNSHLVCGLTEMLVAIPIDEGSQPRMLEGAAIPFAFSQDGRRMVAAHRSLTADGAQSAYRIWNAGPWTVDREIATRPTEAALKSMQGVAWRPDGRQLAVAGRLPNDSTGARSAVFLLDSSTGADQGRLRCDALALCWHPSGARLATIEVDDDRPNASGSFRQPARLALWDTAGNERVLTVPFLDAYANPSLAMAWSVDGQRLTAFEPQSGQATLWSATAGFSAAD